MKEKNYNEFFASRLREQMDKHRISIVGLSQLLGCKMETIYDWLDGCVYPSNKRLKDLSVLFKVDAAYWKGE